MPGAPSEKLRSLGSTARDRSVANVRSAFPPFRLLLAPQAPVTAHTWRACEQVQRRDHLRHRHPQLPAGLQRSQQDAWKIVGDAAGMQHVPTRPEVIRAYLRVQVGSRCTEVDRSESERLLRAQRFIASATVRAVPDGPGTRPDSSSRWWTNCRRSSAGASRARRSSQLLLGTQNLDGRGLTSNSAASVGSGTGRASAATS